MSALLTVTEVYSVIVFKRFWKVQYVRQQKTLADFWRLLLYLGVFINGAGTGRFKPLIVKQADPVHPPAPLPFLSIFSSHMKRGPFWGHWSCSQAKVLPLRSPPGKPGQHIKALDSRQTPQRPLQGRGSGLEAAHHNRPAGQNMQSLQEKSGGREPFYCQQEGDGVWRSVIEAVFALTWTVECYMSCNGTLLGTVAHFIHLNSASIR